MERNWIEAGFLNPPAEYRTAPFWVWNDEVTRETIDFQLEDYKKHGFGGAFVHPRPGLITEYLSEEWFSLWGYALEKAKELGLKLYIYDENSYPSSFAGGHVPAKLPDCFSTSAEYRIVKVADLRETDVQGGKIYQIAALQQKDGSWVLTADLTEIPFSEWPRYGDTVMVIWQQEPQLLSWLGGFANVDLLRPEVTKAFLDCTYEEYYARFGADFGEIIPAAFSDEPAITGSTIYNFGNKNNLPFSYWIAARFEERNGYSILPHMAALFQDVECSWYRYPAKKIRYDYYTTLRMLWTENFIKPMGEWCGRHHIAWTGHFMENYWPFAVGVATSPCVMANYEHMQWPGIDMLQTDVVKYQPTDPLLLTVLEISSVANQFGKERTLCETYGAGGWDASLPDFKRMADWLLVNGVTFINQHLSFNSIAGSRKRDHPQSFDWREPWWEEYTQLNDYVARAQFILSAGRSEQRILVLQPTTAGFLVPPEMELGNLAYKVPVTSPEMRSYLEMLQRLTDGQWDFDLGDEFILENNSCADGGFLTVGLQKYQVLLMNGNMVNMRECTRRLLLQYLRQGGQILCWGKPGPYIEGQENSSGRQELTGQPGFFIAESYEELETRLRQEISNRICREPLPAGIAHRRRVLPDGRVLYFFVNSSQQNFCRKLYLPEPCFRHWDLWTGKQGPEESSPVMVELHPGESLLLVSDFSQESSARPEESLPSAMREVPVRLSALHPEGKNVFPVDYCTLTVGDDCYQEIQVIAAGDVLFKKRGFPGNPWDNSIQFRSRIMDQNHFPEGSGFSLAYTFYVSSDWLPGTPVELIAERGSFYALSCNGRKAEWSLPSAWLEKTAWCAEIGDLIQPGKNEILLTAPRFDVRLEPEAIYLRGDFSVLPEETQWRLHPPLPLNFGSWTEQGRPFYEGACCYTFSFDLPEHCDRAWLELPKTESSCCAVWINDTFLGVDQASLFGPIPLHPYLRPGENKVLLRVCGSLRNLLGPHYDPGRPRNNVWPTDWKKAPKYRRPAPAQHDLISYGLLEMPHIYVPKHS